MGGVGWQQFMQAGGTDGERQGLPIMFRNTMSQYNFPCTPSLIPSHPTTKHLKLDVSTSESVSSAANAVAQTTYQTTRGTGPFQCRSSRIGVSS